MHRSRMPWEDRLADLWRDRFRKRTTYLCGASRGRWLPSCTGHACHGRIGWRTYGGIGSANALPTASTKSEPNAELTTVVPFDATYTGKAYVGWTKYTRSKAVEAPRAPKKRAIRSCTRATGRA